MKIRNLEISRTSPRSIIMGILNVTPDSFSDGGRFVVIDDVLREAERMINDGADILDIGGESTRPGSTPVSAELEQRRILPPLSAIRSRFDIPVSVDTYRASTAAAALDAGADIVNDIWGLRHPADERREMAALIASRCCPVVIMHNRASNIEDSLFTNKPSDKNAKHYQNQYIQEIIGDLAKSVQVARDAGIRDEQIILDPGIGFAKSHPGNMFTMAHAEELAQLGYPLLLGISRKSIIGKTLDLPVTQREEATIALNVIGRMKGYNIFRVHDVKMNKRALEMTDAVLKARKYK